MNGREHGRLPTTTSALSARTCCQFVGKRVGQIRRHSDGDEEQHGEGLAERKEVEDAYHLIAARRLADHDSGHEHTKGQGDAEEGVRGGERRPEQRL